MVAIAGRLKGDVECLRYCLVQDAQSVKQHVWGAHKKFFVLTKCAHTHTHIQTSDTLHQTDFKSKVHTQQFSVCVSSAQCYLLRYNA